jgi:hypothetical protein
VVREGRLWLLIFAASLGPAAVWAGLSERAPSEGPIPEPIEDAASSREPAGAGGSPAVRAPAAPPVGFEALDAALVRACSMDAGEAKAGRALLDAAAPAARRAWVERQRGGLDPEIAAALSYLDDARRRACRPDDRASLLPTAYAPVLARRAKRHAEFLLMHHDLGWPAVHTEPPELIGASPEGDAAGRHSVIAYGCPTIREAIDGFLTTWFHRLPLLQGAVAVGWGSCAEIQVLDFGTLVEALPGGRDVRWPADGAQDVPLRFASKGESPEPVPGVFDPLLGYPITLQVGNTALLRDATASLEVRRGTTWTDVPAFLSTPRRSLQPKCRPPDAICLLPRRALDPGAEHRVTVVGTGDAVWTWNFRTLDATADVEGLLSMLRTPGRERLIARDQLRALDPRWHAALPALRMPPGLDAIGYGITVDAEDRIRGSRRRIDGRSMDDHLWDYGHGGREAKQRAVGAARKYLLEVRRRCADPAAYAEDGTDAARALRLLNEALDARDAAVREAAIGGLAESGTRHPGYEFRLAGRLDDDAALVRSAALRALADLDRLEEGTKIACLRRTRDDDDDVRWEAGLCLAKFEVRWDGVVQALARGAESFRTERRLRAAEALLPYRDQADGREALERLAREDPSEKVRARALGVLRAP